jgi:hypothetical protein
VRRSLALALAVASALAALLYFFGQRRSRAGREWVGYAPGPPAPSDAGSGSEAPTAPPAPAEPSASARDSAEPTDKALPDEAPPQEAPPQEAPPQEAPPQEAPPQEAPPQEAPPQEAPPHSFELIDLGELPKTIAETVADREPLTDAALLAALEERVGEIPADYHRLVTKLAWSAKGRGFIGRQGDDWVAGQTPPAAVEALRGKTLDGLARRAAELRVSTGSEKTALEELVHEVYPGEHPPRVLTSVLGTAFRLAERRAGRDVWG